FFLFQAEAGVRYATVTGFQTCALPICWSGVVRLVRIGTDLVLRFEDVDIAGAPDMYVYLSDRTDGQPGAFVDLGKLKATNGSFKDRKSGVEGNSGTHGEQGGSAEW